MSSTAANDTRIGIPFDVAATARRVFRASMFCDERLFDRVAKVWATGARLFVEPGSGEDGLATRADRRGAQRLYENRRVRSAPLRTRGAEYMMELVGGAANIVVMHDSSEIDLAGRWEPSDAGPLRSNSARGYMLHAMVLIDADRHLARGFLDAWAWDRSWEFTENDQSRPAHRKESYKWKLGLMRALAVAPEMALKWIHVMDREGDVHENFEFADSKKLKVIVGARGDHRIKIKNGTAGKLRSYLLHQPIAASRTLEMTSSTTGSKEVRELTLRKATVTLIPAKKVPGHSKRKPVTVNVVYVRGEQPNQRWMLLTTCSIDTIEQAWAVFDAYRTRTVGEDGFKMLKTGLQIESGSIRDIASFRRKIAILLPLATTLLHIRWLAREAPKALASEHVDATTLQYLSEAARFHRLTMPRRNWTMGDVITCIARLGGYEKRSDQSLGWLTLWRGWRVFTRFRSTLEYARSGREEPGI